jgi:hypothetical protein
MILWGIARGLDEHFWLGEDGKLGSLLVQVAGVLLVVGGASILFVTRKHWAQWRSAPEPESLPADATLAPPTA